MEFSLCSQFTPPDADAVCRCARGTVRTVKRKTARVIDTKVGSRILNGSRSAWIDPDVKRSKVKITRLSSALVVTASRDPYLTFSKSYLIEQHIISKSNNIIPKTHCPQHNNSIIQWQSNTTGISRDGPLSIKKCLFDLT